MIVEKEEEKKNDEAIAPLEHTQIQEEASKEIPTQMWAIQCTEEGKLQIKKIATPIPAYGEVLVKCLAAPINPSDLGMMKGVYSEHKLFKINYPTSSGWEGSGIVVQYGGYSIMGRSLMGQRVAFTRYVEPTNEMIQGGCYQQYVIANVLQCIPIPQNVSMPVGSMHFVNPLTAVGLVERIQTLGAKAAVQTAAAGQLGKMIIRLCQMSQIELINVVRKEEQVRMLKDEMGCKYVLNSSTPDFIEQFQKLTKELKATVLVECIGGDTTATYLEKMPAKSTCIMYGSLREIALEGFDPLLIIGRSYSVEGFILAEYIKEKGTIFLLPVIRKVTNMMNDTTLQSKVQKCCRISEFKDSISLYYSNMTAGKVILCPNEFDQMLESASEDSDILKEFDIKDLNSN